MAWINEINYDESEGKLRQLYDRIKGPENNVDNILMAHSLRPHTLTGHLQLYKNVLHHKANKLPKWYLETIGVYVSILNNCSYCVEHHYEGLKRLLDNNARANQIRRSFESGNTADVFEGKLLTGLDYARKLTYAPGAMIEDEIVNLRNAGFDDGEILELNQVISYFAYANRTVLGLGVNTDGDILGLSPSDSDNENNWTHQ